MSLRDGIPDNSFNETDYQPVKRDGRSMCICVSHLLPKPKTNRRGSGGIELALAPVVFSEERKRSGMNLPASAYVFGSCVRLLGRVDQTIVYIH